MATSIVVPATDIQKNETSGGNDLAQPIQVAVKNTSSKAKEVKEEVHAPAQITAADPVVEYKVNLTSAFQVEESKDETRVSVKKFQQE